MIYLKPYKALSAFDLHIIGMGRRAFTYMVNVLVYGTESGDFFEYNLN